MRDLIFKRLLSICCILILLISAGMIYSLVRARSRPRPLWILPVYRVNRMGPPSGQRNLWSPFLYRGNPPNLFSGTYILYPFSLPVALFTGEFFRGKKDCHVHQFHYRFTRGNSLDRVRIMGDFIPSARLSSRWESIHKDSEY